MSSNDVFGHKFNAASNWCELAKNNQANKARIEKEKKVWQLFATTNYVAKTNTTATTYTTTTTDTTTTDNNTDSDTVTCT